MSTEFASVDLTAGQLNAIVKKLGGHDGAIKFLQDKLTVSEPTRNWREQDGVIYFSVTSDGTTGPQWIERLEGKGFRLSDYAKSVLRSPDFKPTSGVTTEIAILKGMLFADNDRITKKIRAEADKRKLTKSNAEVACLIRENFSDKEIEALGLWWIVAMHEPIKDSGGGPSLLGADRYDGGRWLNACCVDGPGYGWFREDGFAFVVSQVGPQN
ncbi:MAG: hypothetical protein A3G52_01150 [Candidatus Taylorbacteria bacterium RIFCSPLOWO2_12_FULL_43_20]|uniref:Uncharacterized protein n=1 Tax=Candidatus Taylorbacteria bacterium RIFCSPLOWO2_12_FULL_43_20 TaxID=1802332 RepID=A0A1G2P198_9BACT|nr:MAG: hypothetical protein A2825_01120 [Candidatus Taylorbacteria bacterium RIFCSPHIGHO2_01_FULL_43_120]OHA23157.1 MAG: hypothetical protein A3B98_03380 [Candidatus Taylorbacteria bacterium RIFCSPHIGHO2_02_FULL_43_55]OHA29061.1 MAG: hypothetical protein A3E92_04115 [Candidatus Taylorbacteria bacterium RIFCSPHIGHO2_12_FULL_42_34]OHA32175.1 MAG: hypothetical protein A3B09_03350 [Candidatus Taylorbacteria bacterium RIFCSPLOWO2_01_FULL_43_83]OHA38693.1 MAG: hypothetical protein A3H58_00695 [Candi